MTKTCPKCGEEERKFDRLTYHGEDYIKISDIQNYLDELEEKGMLNGKFVIRKIR